MRSDSIAKRPFNVYLDPAETRWLDSMEGVPETPPARELGGERMLPTAWQKRLHRGLAWLGPIAPGLALAGVLAWAGAFIADFIGKTLLGFEKSPVSAILMTIVLGLLVRNIAGLPEAYEPGLRFAVKRILRFGIALLGLRLSLVAVGEIGLTALPIVIVCIVTALLLVTWFSRWLRLPPRLGSLIAVGTSICGASAIVATAPAIDAEEDEVSYAVACITFFGMAALFAYPFLSHWLFAGDPRQAGFFLGTAIHDTSQVAGAGLMYQQHYDDPVALNVATTTKLVRNLCMGVVIPLMAILHHRKGAAAAGDRRAGWANWHQYVPPFVIAFVVLAAVRSLGDLGPRAFGLIGRPAWQKLIAEAMVISVGCLTVSMGAIGLGTSFGQLKKLGWKPLLVGLTAALLVGGVSLALVKLLVAPV